MTTILLSAGNATRLETLAPAGCKALTRVGDRTMLDWWRGHDPNVIVVCRTEHTKSWEFPDDANVISCDEGGGPAVAVRTALPHVRGPLTVAYADTWVPPGCVPYGTDWCGVATARGGRAWDILTDGVLTYRHISSNEVATVAIGLYRFSDMDRLGRALDTAIEIGDIREETGMAAVVGLYGARFKPVVGWQDVGDRKALERWKALA